MLAKRLNQFDSSAIQKALSGGATGDVIDLSIGYPIENTPSYIKNAGSAAIKHNITRYMPANGPLALRNAIAKKLATENHITVSADQVAVTPGLTTAILIAYLAVLDPGDEILIADPCFPPYKSLANLVGAKVVSIDTYPDFQLTAERLNPYITAKTKLMVINSPNNPTGAVYPEAELRKIAGLAKQNNLLVISDEIYEYFCFSKPHFSIGSIYPNTLTFNGFSKSYAMTGWRVGYVAGPRIIIDAVSSLLQYAVFSSTSISIAAAQEALTRKPIEITNAYREKWQTVSKLLADRSGGGIEGAFYAFLKTPGEQNDQGVCDQLLANGVRVLPGSAFSDRHDYFRVAYTAAKPQLDKALQIITSLYLK